MIAANGPHLPSFAGILSVVQLVGAIVAIVVFVLLVIFIAIILWAVKKQGSAAPSVAKPSIISLREQLQQNRPRYLCFVDLDEIRRITLQRGGELPVAREASQGTSSSRGIQATPVGVGATATAGSSASTTTRFEVPADENMAISLMRALTAEEQVGFGVEAGSPDTAKLEVLNECGRKLAAIGASLPDSFVTRHSSRLRTEGVPSKDEKCEQIRSLCSGFAFVAMRGTFSVATDGAPAGSTMGATTATDETRTISLELPHGIRAVARVPMSKVKEASRHLFAPGRKLENLMLFGPHIGWNDSNLTLDIVPLVIGASWTTS